MRYGKFLTKAEAEKEATKLRRKYKNYRFIVESEMTRVYTVSSLKTHLGAM